MKKVFMIEILGDGGIAHYTYNLVNAINKNKGDVSLITTYTYELNKHDLEAKIYCIFFKLTSLIINRFPMLSKETLIPTIIRRIFKVMEYPFNSLQCLYLAIRGGLRIVHFQSIHLITFFMVALFKLFKMKIIYTIHNVLPGHKKINPIQRVLYSFMFRCCNSIIIHSEISKQEVVDLYKIDPNKIVVIPHGHYQFFIPEKPLSQKEARERIGLSEKKIILFFGAIRANKGLQDLLQAIPLISKEVSDILLLIAGEPLQDYTKYQNIISFLKIHNYIHEILKYIPMDEVPTYFYASDLVALPYHEISQSGILQLAYAFEKPVVATAIGGFLETVEDGKNGFLVPPKKPHLLAEKIIALLRDDKKAKNMGKHSLHLSNSKYGWDAISQKTIQLYSENLTW